MMKKRKDAHKHRKKCTGKTATKDSVKDAYCFQVRKKKASVLNLPPL